MREFIPSDYIDKEGNVYETVGENIREGKNGAVTSDFPTPEDIGNGLVGSDGKNYTTVLKNLGAIPQSNIYAIVGIEKNGIMNWVPVINTITESNKNSYVTPSIKGVVEYINSKIPNDGSNYSWVTANVTYDNNKYSIDATSLNINANGAIYSDTKNIIDLFPISTTEVIGKTQTIGRGITGSGKFSVVWDIKASYTAKILVEG